MTAAQYTGWQPCSNVLYTLEVVGTLSETSRHTYSDKTQKLRREGSKVTFSCLKDRTEYFAEESVQQQASVPLRQHISDSIRDNPRLQKVFAKVFAL